MMRLDKFLSETNTASRKEAKALIKQGRITVNGIKARDAADHINENNDIICVDNKVIQYEKYVYFMLNKPSGLVSATEDNVSETVIDLFKEENIPDLFPVGRLDKDTTGLLIITNDGDLGHRLTSPAHHIYKTYEVNIEHPLTTEDINRLENGVELIGDGITKPAKVNVIDDKRIYLTITEGKFHQVKRMLLAVSNKVVALKRISMGAVTLDNELTEGRYRRLTDDEIAALKS